MAHGVEKHQLLVIGPTEPWSVREKLCLATSVMKSGDKNWVSVSRAIKPFAEPGRPPDWFSHKHCASKYSELLETAEAPNQKRGNGGEAVETVKDVIVRRLTTDRIDALRKLIKETREKHRKLKREAELIQAGCLDSKLEELWGDILQKKKVEEKETELKRKSTNAAYRARQVAKPHNSQAQRGIPARSPPGCSPPGQVFSPGDPLEGLTLDRESMKNPSGLAGPTATAESSGPGSDDVSPGSLLNDPAQWNVSSQKATPPPSPLLSELLKKGSIMATHSRLIGEGDVTTANITGAPDLRLAPTSQPLTQATGAPMLSRLLEAGPAWFSAPLGFVVVADSASGTPPPAAAPLSVHSSAASANTERSSPSGCRPVPPEDKGDVTVSYVGGELDPKTVGDIIAIIEDKTDVTAEALDAAAVEAALSLCEEDGRALPGAWGPGPFQPNGSLEAAPTGPRGLPRTSSSKASQQQDAPHGDSVLEDSPLAPRRRKEVRTEDGRSLHAASSSSSTRPRAAADSASSSPASSQLYANVFLQPVTDEIAPGYHGIVQRPTDLAAIKKSIETGSIRNTAEFQRDVMLMFQNAVMYNSLDHDVHHMALEMQRDVLEQIQQFLATQLIMEASESDPSKQDVPDKDTVFMSSPAFLLSLFDGGTRGRRCTIEADLKMKK